MRVTVQALRANGTSCEAISENNILFVFPISQGSHLHLGNIIELNPLVLNQAQLAHNVSTNQQLNIVLKENDIHDLRQPSGHGTSRTPTKERLLGA